MKKLKRLIEYGSDTELIEYIRNTFYERIDKYLDLDSELSEMKKKYIKLAEDSSKREQRINEFHKKTDSILSGLAAEVAERGV